MTLKVVGSSRSIATIFTYDSIREVDVAVFKSDRGGPHMIFSQTPFPSGFLDFVPGCFLVFLSFCLRPEPHSDRMKVVWHSRGNDVCPLKYRA